jgi:uncharacterized protein (TIGR02449 family)
MDINMEEININHLQLQVENLIHSRSKLDAENKLLRKKLTQTIQERAILSNKMATASQKLNNIISRIKEEIL